MRQTMPAPRVTLARQLSRVATAVILSVCGLVFAPMSQAGGPTNVIWEATFSGTLAIQDYDQQVTPRLASSPFKEGDFLSFLGLPSGDLTVAVNVDMTGSRTNLYLTIYDRVSRQNLERITTAENTTLIQDGQNLTFTMDARMPANPPSWGGGQLRIAGRGKIVDGIPAAFKGNVTGVFVDLRPGDIGGTTGLVVRAKISTAGKPARVQPPVP